MAWAPDYATTAELRAYATRSADTVDDGDLALAVTAASRAIDREANRQFGKVAAAEERVYTPRWDRRRCRWVIDIDDIAAAAGLVVEIAGVALTAYTLEPRNAIAEGRPFERLVVDVDSAVVPAGDEYEAALTTDQWGWAATPSPIKQGTLMQGNRLFSRRVSPFGIAGSPDVGSELRLLARLDPDVRVVIGPYIRWWAAR